jgi:hypothetical protein
VRTVPRFYELYPGICLKTEVKAWKSVSQGSRTIRKHRPNNKNTLITALNRNTTIYWYKMNLKNMKECDNIKIHISSNFLLSICLLITLDTLLLVPSPHCNTSLHFTTIHTPTLHYNYRHFTSSHLHFTTLSFGLTHIHFLPFYFTSHH